MRLAFLAPAALSVLAPSPVLAAETFDTQIALDYRVRYQATAARGHGVEGWANNELALDARFRAEEFVAGLAGFRNKVPLAIGPLSAQPTPQPAVESSRWDVFLAYMVEVGEISLLPRASYTFAYTVPATNVPWTGTPLDFGQTRQGPGVGLEAAYDLGPFALIGRAHVVPSLATTLSGAPYPIEPVIASEAGLRVSYALFPGLRASVDLARHWADGKDQSEYANVFSVGLAYLPVQVRL
ncbi:MAG: hypothetical protein FJZ01_26490 [Candidatus Sericytochromatia bacterium]|nr:hypothetical protein [Candidatus Tanganyikabacteria bacterium]